ncbi:DnaJ domain, zinc finger, CCHC-type, tetratricopeptide-like helical domain protein, partial [Tanacetum coccineum]
IVFLLNESNWSMKSIKLKVAYVLRQLQNKAAIDALSRAVAYFNKIQCFCFEEQRLLLGGQIDMPIIVADPLSLCLLVLKGSLQSAVLCLKCADTGTKGSSPFSAATVRELLHIKAISRRANLHAKIRDYEEAALDLQRLVCLLEKRNEKKYLDELTIARRRLSSTNINMKKGMTLDLYLILGLKGLESGSEIKKAYHKAALKHHPDKAGIFLARSESVADGHVLKEIFTTIHQDADKLFKKIGEAYAVLSDASKQYEQFTILEEESIDSGFARFNTIITNLKALDEGFSSKNYVRKFLRTLNPKWRAKVMAIKESKDLSSLALDELIAKKESSDDETLTSGSDDEEYALAIRNFKKFFRRKDAVIQIISLAIVQNYLATRSNAFIEVSWSDSEKDADTKQQVTCLMAQSSNVVTLNYSHYSDNASSL